jgi:hypothetical protein
MMFLKQASLIDDHDSPEINDHSMSHLHFKL